MASLVIDNEHTTTSLRNKKYKGVLSLLREPLFHHEDYDPDILAESTRRFLKSQHYKHKHHTTAQPPSQLLHSYDPSKSFLTLFFLGDSNNRNAIRFRPRLVQFCQAQQDQKSVQTICILQQDNTNSTFCDGTGFFYMTTTHPNRTALLTLLAASCVPSVIVVDNATGRRITDLGMQAIDMNSDDTDAHVVEQWKLGKNGLTTIQWTMTSCHIS